MTLFIDDLIGVWRRELIAWPDGRRDTTTSVHWLQTRTAFADLRLPLAPDPGTIEGFAGHVALDGDVCTWHRHLDYQPPGAPPDVGRLRFDGDLLVEDGVHQPYVEHWRRIDDGAQGLLVLRLAEADQMGLIVRAGRHVMRAIANSTAFAAEISHAMTAGPLAWQIHSSSRPARVGERLGFHRDGEYFVDGEARRWRLTEASAVPEALLP